jgi:Na+-transporting NADH:ubiquinone oxidoreductase subunit NqrF
MSKKVRTRDWHLFGNCGGWDEFHVWCYTKQQAMLEADPYIKAYGFAYLENVKTNKVWKIKPIDNLTLVEKLAEKRKLI